MKNTKEVMLISQALRGFSVQGKFSSLVSAVQGVGPQVQNVTSGTEKSDVITSVMNKLQPSYPHYKPKKVPNTHKPSQSNGFKLCMWMV